MEPHEILAEIRKDCPVKPFPYLLDHPNSIESLRGYYGESNDGAKCWDLIDLIDSLLLSKLSIGLFVAAKDGKPLEVPTMDAIRKENSLHTPWDLLLINRQREYAKAQQEVIFEGWEVLEIENEGLDIKVTNSKSPFSFWFYQFPLDESYWIVTLNQRGINSFKIKSLSKLAEATQSNPLKLK